MKQTLLVDCDGVLGAFVPHLLKWLHTSTPPSAIVSWDFNLFLSEKEKAHKDLILEQDEFWMTIPVMPGAQQAIDHLRKDFDVVCVSTPWRKRDFKGWEVARERWLKAYFDFHPDDVVLTRNKNRVVGDILIDDRPKNIERFASTGRKAVVFNQPWNQEVKDHARMYTWQLEEVSRLLRPQLKECIVPL